MSSFSGSRDIFHALMTTRTSASMRSILAELGDGPHIRLDETFGEFGFFWHPFGDNTSNLSSIGLASKPGRSLTERLTNAVDAVLEERALSHTGELPSSAREAASRWFGRPVTSSNDGLYNWNYRQSDGDRKIHFVLLDSEVKDAPTVDVLDSGIGIQPGQFPSTILSLQSGNKITKRYVQGAFGQGGASTLAFCEYAIIASRYCRQKNVIGFTIIKEIRLDDFFKENCYVYLAMHDASGAITVPTCQLDDEALPLYDENKGIKVPTFGQGTFIRHIDYRLEGLTSSFQLAIGNLYQYLHCTAFDPLLPFRIVDLRGSTPTFIKNELVNGSRNKLMAKVKSSTSAEGDTDSSRTEIKHRRPMEYVAPLGSSSPCIGIEYWVPVNYRKKTDKDKVERFVVRGNTSELYAEKGHPILFTLNGQNQGQLSTQLLKDIGLGMISRHIVVHVDCTNADNITRRQLFTTNREILKDGPVLTSIKNELIKTLKEDDVLNELERQFTDEFTKTESEATNEEIKRQVAQLLREAGFELKEAGPDTASTDAQTKEKTTQSRRKGRYQAAEPLPTRPYPEVTKLQIVYPTDRLEVQIGDSQSIHVETDADTEFDKKGLIHIRSEPNCLEVSSKSELRGGRIRWRLRPLRTANAGEVGKVIVSLTKPSGEQLTASIDFKILPAEETTGEKARGVIPPFDIIAIDPDDDAWPVVWENLDPEDTSEDDLAHVAYKPVKASDRINVYYSTVFKDFKEQLEKLKSQDATLGELYVSSYKIWIAYHAILQESSRNEVKTSVNDADLEKLLESDRTRVAKMQVKQAVDTAKLRRSSLGS